MSTKKIVNICLIIAVFFVYLVAAQIAELIFDWLNIPTKSLVSGVGLTAVHVIAFGVAALSLFVVLRQKKLTLFLHEAALELAKVTYPSRKESGQSALIVIVMVAVATACLMVFDKLWQFVTRYILTS